MQARLAEPAIIQSKTMIVLNHDVPRQKYKTSKVILVLTVLLNRNKRNTEGNGRQIETRRDKHKTKHMVTSHLRKLNFVPSQATK